MKKISSLLAIIAIIMLFSCQEQTESYANNDDLQSNETTEIENVGGGFDDITVKQEIAEQVDTNAIVVGFEFNEELKTKIKKILSDPNPDPENKSGNYCSDYIGSCKWCNAEIRQSQAYKTAQSAISNYLFNPFSMYGAALYSIGGETAKAEFRSAFNDICNEFENNNKYICELEGSAKEFCSLKCENEYKYR